MQKQFKKRKDYNTEKIQKNLEHKRLELFFSRNINFISVQKAYLSHKYNAP